MFPLSQFCIFCSIQKPTYPLQSSFTMSMSTLLSLTESPTIHLQTFLLSSNLLATNECFVGVISYPQPASFTNLLTLPTLLQTSCTRSSYITPPSSLFLFCSHQRSLSSLPSLTYQLNMPYEGSVHSRTFMMPKGQTAH